MLRNMEIDEALLLVDHKFDLLELQKKVNENSINHGFWNASSNLTEKLMLITSEIFELYEAYRTNTLNDDCDKGIGLSYLEEELADVIIRVADLAEHLKIDLSNAVKAKHNYNLTRPHMHGNKIV